MDVGHSSVHPALLDGAREHVSQAIERKLLIDGYSAASCQKRKRA
jgi:fructose 1,6-bisphosphatase